MQKHPQKSNVSMSAIVNRFKEEMEVVIREM